MIGNSLIVLSTDEALHLTFIEIIARDWSLEIDREAINTMGAAAKRAALEIHVITLDDALGNASRLLSRGQPRDSSQDSPLSFLYLICTKRFDDSNDLGEHSMRRLQESFSEPLSLSRTGKQWY